MGGDGARAPCPRGHAAAGGVDIGSEGGDRRARILRLLQEAQGPVPGADLARRLGVSRQVVVQDVAILRAAGHEILATPQGYRLPAQAPRYREVLAVRHGPEETEAELLCLVDHGLRVVDVMVEHPLYGELRGYLMLACREDVRRFVKAWREAGASLLSSLTGGLHLHTVEAEREEDVARARARLAEMGILVVEARGKAEP